MNMYLLLRDNKQTGPFALDELKSKGLKAYDLVWIEGKSAAWRYPCEIDELKPFAPVVEEQPFDRFYKKPSETNLSYIDTTVSAPLRATMTETFSGTVVTYTKTENEKPVLPGKRTIYVNLPAGTAKRESFFREPIQAVQPQMAPPVNFSEAEAIVPRDNSTFSTKKSIESDLRPKRRDRSRILQPVAVGACVLAILAAGIFIGLSINKDNFALRQKLADNKPLTNLKPNAETRSLSQPAATNPPAAEGASPVVVSRVTPTPLNAGNAGSSSAEVTAAKPKRQNTGKDKAVTTGQKRLVAAPVTTTKDSAGLSIVHREAVHDPAIVPEKEPLRPNLANLVSVGASKFNVGTFGGISNLQLTVSNHSSYSLSLVVVEVQYVQANKKIYKTENLYFHDIGPGAALMIEAPKTSRGIKVQYKITTINSKESGLSYSAI